MRRPGRGTTGISRGLLQGQVADPVLNPDDDAEVVRVAIGHEGLVLNDHVDPVHHVGGRLQVGPGGLGEPSCGQGQAFDSALGDVPAMAVGDLLQPVEGVLAEKQAQARDADVETKQGGLASSSFDYGPALGHVHLEQLHRALACLPGIGRESLDRELRVPVVELKFPGLSSFNEVVPDPARPNPANRRGYVRRLGEDPRQFAHRVVVHTGLHEQVIDDLAEAVAGEHLHHLVVGVDHHMTVVAQVVRDRGQLHRSGRPLPLPLAEAVADLRLADIDHGIGIHWVVPGEFLVADELHGAAQGVLTGCSGRFRGLGRRRRTIGFSASRVPEDRRGVGRPVQDDVPDPVSQAGHAGARLVADFELDRVLDVVVGEQTSRAPVQHRLKAESGGRDARGCRDAARRSELCQEAKALDGVLRAVGFDGGEAGVGVDG